MTSELHLKTTVLSGSRIEISAPGLPEGLPVEVTLHYAAPAGQSGGTVALLDSLPPGPRSAPTWEELDQEFKAERSAWDR